MPRKVGQCALAVGDRRVRFLDRLHLLPSHDRAWTSALTQIAIRFGPGTYSYGSLWNHERRSLSGTGALLLPGRVADDGLRLDCIDFGAWAGFAAYRRGVSENLRRGFKKSAAASPTVVTRRGLDAVRDVPALVALRKQVMRRNDEPFSAVVDGPKHALN